jgi:hypothetical protein
MDHVMYVTAGMEAPIIGRLEDAYAFLGCSWADEFTAGYSLFWQPQRGGVA